MQRKAMFAAPRGSTVIDASTPRLHGPTGLFARPAGRLAEHVAAPADAADRFVVRIMSLDLLATVVLQRIYLGISVTLATHALAMAILFLYGRLRLSATRLALYWLFWGSAVALAMASGNTFSAASLLLGLICYVPFLVVIPANSRTYFEVVRVYQRIALAVAGLVFLDLALQVAGFGMPSMDAVVPARITAPTMNYIQPLAWRAGLTKPNAFFMLEASYTSQFIAIALLIELAFFRRWAWLSTFALGVLGTFSGTGLLLILVSLPILARRFWRTLLLYGLILVPVIGGVAVATGWYEIASGRATSFEAKGSSANQRFVEPFVAIYDMLASADTHRVVFGYGAGKTSTGEVVPGLEVAEYNPVSKVFIEYGVVVFVAFVCFITYCFFSTGAPFFVAYVLAAEYHLMGGHLLLPPILNYCLILSTGWAISRADALPAARGDWLARFGHREPRAARTGNR